MSESRRIVLDVFARLRRDGFLLGLGELLAALRALDGGFGAASPDDLRLTLKLLWCHSPEGEHMLDRAWQAVIAAASARDRPGQDERLADEITLHDPAQRPADKRPLMAQPEAEAVAVGQQTAAETILPIPDSFSPIGFDGPAELRAYWPVSRRYMVYTWRYLRRLVPDGPPTVLDIDATIERTARQGFFLAPIYRRRERNLARLVLLLDQGGSMAPFHRFTRDMVETARYESTIEAEHVEVFYFHNVPAEHAYVDPHLTEPIALAEVLRRCSGDSSVLVVSDAGAARGYRRMKRIRATTEFLRLLGQQTTLIAWLNPMPEERWPGSSAQIIAHLVAMFQMDPDGFSSAVDVLRGQPLRHFR